MACATLWQVSQGTASGVFEFPMRHILLSFASLLVLDDVSHAGLVANEGGKVNGLGGVISGE